MYGEIIGFSEPGVTITSEQIGKCYARSWI